MSQRQQTPSHNALDELPVVLAPPTAAQWSAGEASFSAVAPRVLRQETGKEASKGISGTRLLLTAQQEVYRGTAGSTTPGGSLYVSAGTPDAPVLHFPHSVSTSKCGGKNKIQWGGPSENRPGSMGKRETTNLNYSTTTMETKRFLASSLVSGKNQRHKSLRIIAQEGVRPE